MTRCHPQMLKRLMTVCSAEGVDCSDEGGLEAIIFTAEGDMRQALNNLQVLSESCCSYLKLLVM